MENKSQNVFDRLDSIEALQSATQTQNQQILDLLNKLSNQQPVKQNVDVKPKPQSQVLNQGVLKKFLRSSYKEYVWFGPISEFNKSKMICTILYIALIIVGGLSTIITSIALKMYSIFSLFENIWLIFAHIMYLYSASAKKRMEDTDLRDNSIDVFVQDDTGLWKNTGKEKKRFRWFRRMSFIAVVCNIITIWVQSKGGIVIAATLFEIAFSGIIIGNCYAYLYLYSMYSSFILFTGKNASNTETVTLVFDVICKKFAPFEEYKEKLKEHL